MPTFARGHGILSGRLMGEAYLVSVGVATTGVVVAAGASTGAGGTSVCSSASGGNWMVGAALLGVAGSADACLGNLACDSFFFCSSDNCWYSFHCADFLSASSFLARV